MYYMNIEDSTKDEIMDIVKDDLVFLMNVKQKSQTI